MTTLLKTGSVFNWTTEQENALCELKHRLIDSPVLAWLCWSQRQVALAWLVHTIFANGSKLSNQNAQLECFRMFRRFPDVSEMLNNYGEF
jgi:hypothetical protein